MARASVNGGFFATVFASTVLVAGSGCGSSRAEPSAPPSGTSAPPSGTSASGPAAIREAAPSSSAPAVVHPPLDDAGIFAHVKDGLVACYEKGRASVPNMLDGQLTLNASFDAAGAASCVIVSDDKGLTQEVEDCMAAHLSTQRLEGASRRPISLRIALRAGQLALAASPRERVGIESIESIETHRMPDAFDVLEALAPKLQACMSGVPRGTGPRSALVGARVATSGRTRCALAMGSPDPLPADAATCAESVLRNATFPAPSGGEGLILVPMTLVRR